MFNIIIIIFVIIGITIIGTTLIFLIDDNKKNLMICLHSAVIWIVSLQYFVLSTIDKYALYLLVYMVASVIISPLFDIFMVGKDAFASITKMWEVKLTRDNEPHIKTNYHKYELCLYAPFRIPYCIVIGLYNAVTIGLCITTSLDKFLDNLVVKKVEKSHKNK